MNILNMKHLFTVLSVGGALILLESCTDGKSATMSIPKGADPIPVTVVALSKTTTNAVIRSSGKLATEEETLLSFKTGGVVNSVLVKEGDHVTKGQLLATLDLTEINTLVAQARFGYEKAQRDFKRVTNLYADSVATLEQLQNAQTSLSVAKEQLESAAFNRSFSEIHAQAPGYVLRKFVNAGRVVGVGDPILLTNAATSGQWILKIGVSDRQWSTIQLKDRATVALDAFPGRSFQATVCRKAEASDPATGAFTIELRLHDDGAKLATGMFGSATLQSQASLPSWNVPYEAVLDANGDEGFVFVTSDNKTAEKRAVTIGSFSGNHIQITGGLEDAAALILSGSAYLADQSPIKIIK